MEAFRTEAEKKAKAEAPLQKSARRAHAAAPPTPASRAGGGKFARQVCNWLQCDECGKWRVVSSALFARVSADARWMWARGEQHPRSHLPHSPFTTPPPMS
jgi:hypothetical protein